MEDNPWTEALVAELRCLVGQRVSYAAIARQLGVSRNAAIGKANRLRIGAFEDDSVLARARQAGLGSWRRGVSAQPSWQPAMERLPSLPPSALRCEPVPPAVSSDPLNLRMDQLRFYHCRYITNDDMREPTYCGRNTVDGTSWCGFHLARVRAPQTADESPLACRKQSQR